MVSYLLQAELMPLLPGHGVFVLYILAFSFLRPNPENWVGKADQTPNCSVESEVASLGNIFPFSLWLKS